MRFFGSGLPGSQPAFAERMLQRFSFRALLRNVIENSFRALPWKLFCLLITFRARAQQSAEESQLRYLRAILVLFEAVSGLKINLGKSSMYAINVVQDIERLGEVLVCQIGELPTDYLGMPLGARYKSEQIWLKIDRCEMRLAMWKSQYLSLGGGVILINSVLDSLPTYLMSLFPMPMSVKKKLDRIRRDFLWEGNKDRRSFHLVKWDKVLLEISEGGHGIRNLKSHNDSLLLKWLWRYGK
nr:uncharacterized protein LOC104090636 [Nicotiana tomentosiformis]